MNTHKNINEPVFVIRAAGSLRIRCDCGRREIILNIGKRSLITCLLYGNSKCSNGNLNCVDDAIALWWR